MRLNLKMRIILYNIDYINGEPMKSSSILMGAVAGVVLTSLAFLSFSVFISTADRVESQTQDEYNIPERPVFNVNVDLAKQIDFETRITATGRTRARREALIIPQAGGLVTEVPVRDGMRVRRGQTLFKLDDREYRIALREAEDRLLERQIEYNIMKAGPTPDAIVDTATQELLDELEQNYRRARELFENGEITEREFTHIRREYETTLTYFTSRREEVIANKSGLSQAEQAYERAKLNLSFTDVRAPFDGYVAQLDIQEGMTVQTGRDYLKVVDLFTVHIEVGVIESELPHIHEGSQVYARFPSLGNKRFEGNVYTISPLIDPETRTARVTVAIPNPDGMIKAGMFASVEIVTNSITDALVVPREAVLVRDQRELVFRIENNVAKWHYVTTGRRNPEYIQILDGISGGDTVAVGNHYTLAHDARVRIR